MRYCTCIHTSHILKSIIQLCVIWVLGTRRSHIDTLNVLKPIQLDNSTCNLQISSPYYLNSHSPPRLHFLAYLLLDPFPSPQHTQYIQQFCSLHMLTSAIAPDCDMLTSAFAPLTVTCSLQLLPP